MSLRPAQGRVDLDARYGRTPRRRGVVAVAVAAAVLVGLAIAWFVWARPIDTGAQVQWVDRGFTTPSDSEAQATFVVTLDTGSAAQCAVEARNDDFAIVGWKVVDVPVSSERSRTFTVDLRSTDQAVAVAVNSCWIVGS